MYIQHKKITTIIQHKPNVFIYLCLLLFSIPIVRYNIINSIHNFINNNNQNQYDIYITTIVVFFILCIFIQTKNNTKINKICYLFLFFVIFLSAIVLVNLFVSFLKIKHILYYLVFFITIFILNKNFITNS